jgi:hypothetical protein
MVTDWGNGSMADSSETTGYRVGGWSLSPGFQLRLDRDGFQHIGYHRIIGKNYSITLNNLKADWNWVVYAFVSFADGGKYMRIGKVEEAGLRGRLTPRYLNHALHLALDLCWVKERMARWRYSPSNATAEMLSERGRLTTPPWEREMWVEYLVPFGGHGLIFARPPIDGENNRRALSARERELVDRFDPPCNNETRSGRRRRAEWIALHGQPIDITGPRV